MHRISGWLQGESGRTFVHVHLPDERLHHTGILIVPGLGTDLFHGYRALRFLADSTCEQGFLTVRMEFSGTGNNVDTGENAGLADWDHDAFRVLAWLRRCQGIERVCVVANRTGVLFSGSCLESDDELVLWGACTGRLWVREQIALRQLSSVTPTTGSIESGGLVLDPETMDGISAREPVIKGKIRRLLILDRVDRPLSPAVRQHLSGCAGSVCHQSDPVYADCFREPHHASRPDVATRAILEWIGNACSPPAAFPGIDAITELPDAAVQLRTHEESILQTAGMFGILSRPADADSIVLLGNAGAIHHVGPNRLNVELARRLAEQGVATLRYDLSNLGDSVCTGLDSTAPVDEENHPYPACAERDVSSLVVWARSEGFKRVILAGLCSGAYAAFDFARGRHASTPDELILINPLTFQWQPGMSLEIPDEFRTSAQDAHYRNAIRDFDRWRRLFTGQADYAGLLRHLFASLFARIRDRVRRTGIALHLLPRPQLEVDLLRIAASGIRIRFFFSANEPGIDMLNGAGRACLDALRRLHLMSVEFIEQADHTFRSSTRRAELMDAILRTLRGTHERT